MTSAPDTKKRRFGFGAMSTRWIVGVVCRLVLVLLLLIPLIDFATVAFSRAAYPYEVEWLEGEVAVYAIRWQETPTLAHLYPEYGTANYVPHLYPPIYQIVLAKAQGWFGGSHLFVGRLISILATLGIMGAICAIVREATRSWLAGLFGALIYVAYFRVSGYWYDLVRVDSLALAFAMWSAYLILRRRGGIPSIIFGIILAVLAHFTKQTAIFIPVLALAWRMALSLVQCMADATGQNAAPAGALLQKHSRGLVLLAIPAIILAVNFIVLFSRGFFGDFSGVIFFFYEIGAGHSIYYDNIARSAFNELWQYLVFPAFIIPAGIWTIGLCRPWKPGWQAGIAAVVGFLVSLLAAAILVGATPGEAIPRSVLSPRALAYVIATWPVALELAASFTIGGLVIWAIRWAMYRTIVPGTVWIPMTFAAQFVAAVTWVKIGGYINNFMPLLAIQAVLLALCTAWLFRGLERTLGAFGSPIAAALIAACAVCAWQGLSRDKTPAGQRGELVGTYAQLIHEVRQVRGLSPQSEPHKIWRTAGDERVDWRIPNAKAREQGDAVLARIARLHDDGGAYLPHQNYLGWLAGEPIRASADSTRDVSYIGRSTPKPALDAIRNREFKWIVIDIPMQYEWILGDMQNAIRENYEEAGEILPLAERDMFVPRTGAAMTPTILYRAKSAQ